MLLIKKSSQRGTGMSNFFQHEKALVEAKKIGKGTRVWAFAHILPQATIGEECNICDHVFIENDVVVGDRVTIKCGVQLWDGVTLEDDVFIGPNATFTNDKRPRSKQYPDEFARTVVKKGASVGANATILPGITIGSHAMVGAGAVVTKDVPPYATVFGNPARIHGYTTNQAATKVESHTNTSTPTPTPKSSSAMIELSIPGVHIIPLPEVKDLRGALSFGETDKHLPFEVKRYFLVYDVPSKEVRGEHAHRKLHQFLVCVKGSVKVMIDDGEKRIEVSLENPKQGIHIPPMIWATQYHYSHDAVLMVLASDKYQESDYIRNYDEFLKAKAAIRGAK
jgi:UDP-2-acetamido-3-amino-2,3-dideoxy-glucuronate N-acetyltransferase